MKPEQLEGVWLNAHIRALLEERDAVQAENGIPAVSGNGTMPNGAISLIGKDVEDVEVKDATENGTVEDTKNGTQHAKAKDATEEALDQARKMVDAAQKALDTYKSIHGRSSVDDLGSTGGKGANRQNGVGSRELSGEMGGDTSVVV
jgi:hypothetical protein